MNTPQDPAQAAPPPGSGERVQPGCPLSGEVKRGGAVARYMPQGYCPKPWCALVGDVVLRDARGGAKRYSTEAAALKAATAFEEQARQRTGAG
jgi:hypothetical protein